MTNSRIPCDSHKQSTITCILLTINIGIQVRDTTAVKCFQCKAGVVEDPCFSEDNEERQKFCSSADGCMTYRATKEGTTQLVLGGRTCLTRRHLDCIRNVLGLDMKDGRCLQTTVALEKVGIFYECALKIGQGQRIDDGQARQYDRVRADLRICTCNGGLCNKAEIWKPDEFKKENAGGAGAGFGGPQISNVAWLCVAIIVLFTLCPF